MDAGADAGDGVGGPRRRNLPVEPSIGDFNVPGSNPLGVTTPSAPPLPREPTPTDADVLDARDRRRTGETNGNDRKRPDSFAGKNVPKHFSCPITHELFVDPVIFADGHTYERDAIARWLRDHRETSPMTGASFPGRQIVLLPNHAMRSQVEGGRRSRGLSTDSLMMTS